MSRRRIHLGRHLRVLREDGHGVEVEGSARLAPGRPVDLVVEDDAPPRTAMVWTWQVVRMGAERPIYRGYCRWE